MKQLKETTSTTSIRKEILVALFVVQMGVFNQAKAQNELNVLDNNNFSNLNNVLINVNNGRAQNQNVSVNVNQAINIPLSNTMLYNNSRRSNTVTHAPTKHRTVRRRSNTVVAAHRRTNTTASNTTRPGTRNTQRRRPATVPVAPVVNAPTIINPPPAIVNNTGIGNNIAATPVVNVQAEIMNVPVQTNLTNAPVMQTNTTVSSGTHSAGATASTSVRSSHGSSGSKSKHHHMKHFRYSTGKKFQKLFAKNKKGKFNPARCFAWK